LKSSAILCQWSQIFLPTEREPECSINQMRPSSDLCNSRKWFPPPSVPNCFSAASKTLQRRAKSPGPSLTSPFHSSRKGLIPSRLCFSCSPCGPLPVGTSRDTCCKNLVIPEDGSKNPFLLKSSEVKPVSISCTPQPISTPIAYGTIALSAKRTPPIGIPY